MNNKEYSVGVYEKALPLVMPWKDKLEAVKKAGFDFLEISIDESEERSSRLYWTEEERKELIDAIRQTGVPVRTMCFSCLRKYSLGSLVPEKADKVLDLVQRAVDLASELGVRVIQMAAYDVHYEESTPETLAMLEVRLRKAIDIAAKKGVILAFETMFDTDLSDTIEKIMKYVKLMDSPYFKVYPDIGNLALCKIKYGWENIHDDINSGKGHIVACHLKETLPGFDRGIRFGTGVTEYIESLKVLKAQGVRLFNCECWMRDDETWFDDLQFANNFIRERLDKVFVD